MPALQSGADVVDYLAKLAKDRVVITDAQVHYIMQQLLTALAFMHDRKKPVIHRDIKVSGAHCAFLSSPLPAEAAMPALLSLLTIMTMQLCCLPAGADREHAGVGHQREQAGH